MVVAADEGMMPQTREHLEIVRLLGIDRMVVALTKSDLVEEEWLELVEEEVSEALAPTPFGGSRLVRTSTLTGQGLGELVEALAAAAEGARARSGRDIARLPVDRAFTVRGTGTVVTGTLWSGSLRLGQAVVLQPSGTGGRIRGPRGARRPGSRGSRRARGPRWRSREPPSGSKASRGARRW